MRVEADLRVVGARLDGQVATAARRLQLVERERGEVGELRRSRRGQPVAVDAVAREQPGAEAEREREVRRRQPDRLAGVVGRSQEIGVVVADGLARASCVARHVVQVFSSATTSSRDVVARSKLANRSRSWAGVTMPAWCTPWKSTAAPRTRAGAASAALVPRAAGATAAVAASAPAVPRNRRRLTPRSGPAPLRSGRIGSGRFGSGRFGSGPFTSWCPPLLSRPRTAARPVRRSPGRVPWCRSGVSAV